MVSLLSLSWRRKWQPTPGFLPGESRGQRSRRAPAHGVTESDATERRSHGSAFAPPCVCSARGSLGDPRSPRDFPVTRPSVSSKTKVVRSVLRGYRSALPLFWGGGVSPGLLALPPSDRTVRLAVSPLGLGSRGGPSLPGLHGSLLTPFRSLPAPSRAGISRRHAEEQASPGCYQPPFSARRFS